MVAKTYQADDLIDGRFLVQGALGSGGMGVVLRATDLLDPQGKDLAIKVLARPELRRAFVKEATLARGLSHPAFSRCMTTGNDGLEGPLYAVFELCAGEPASPDLNEGLDDARWLRIAEALLSALDHLHRHGRVHGDLAPDNVLLRPDDLELPVRVLDLGASGVEGEVRSGASGALPYLSPERLEGRVLSFSSDLWACGALLHGLLHGTHPFPGYPGSGVTADADPAIPGESTSYDPWLKRMLHPDPEQRFPSVSSALEALSELADRTLSLTTTTTLAAQLRRIPYVDMGGHLDVQVDQIRTAVEEGAPLVLTVQGGPGSGRTALLNELSSELLGRGVQVAHLLGLTADNPGDGWRRALRALGQSEPSGWTSADAVNAARSVLAAAREPGRTLALCVDGAEHLDEWSREGLNVLQQTVESIPDRAGGLLVIRSVLNPQGDLQPWGTEQIRAIVESTLPGRRLSEESAGELHGLTGGVAAVVMSALEKLGALGAVAVDAGAIRLSLENLDPSSLMPATGEELERALEALPAEGRAEAELLAWALGPVPLELLGDGGDALRASDLVVQLSGPGGVLVSLGSPALAQVIREKSDRETALTTWAKRCRTQGTEGERAALRYDAAAGTSAGRKRARAAVLTEDAHVTAGWIKNVVDEAWPDTPEACLRAADAAGVGGASELKESLLGRGLALTDSDTESRQALLVELGEHLGHQARHVEAKEVLEEAIGLGDSPYLGRAYASLSMSAVLTGRLDDAEEAVNAGRDVPNAPEGQLDYVGGLVALYRGDLELAEASLNSAIKLVDDAEPGPTLGAAITALGMVAHRRSDLPSATQRYEEALEFGEARGEGGRVLTALQNLGVVRAESGDIGGALSSYDEAMLLARSLKQTGRVAQVAGNLGHLRMYMGDLRKADDILKMGLTFAREDDNGFLQGLLLTFRGEARMADERWSEALRDLEQAQVFFEEAKAITELSEALLALGRLHLERQDYGAARRAASRAHELARDSDLASQEVQALALIGASHGGSVHGDQDTARQLLDEALARVDTIPLMDARWPVWLEAARQAAREGDLHRCVEAGAEVRRILRTLEDQVPSSWRTSFRGQRQRRRAWQETVGLQANPEPVMGARDSSGSGANEEHWRRLVEVNRRLSGEHDMTALLEYVMDSAVLLSGAERGFLLLPTGADQEEVDVRVARNLDQENIKRNKLKISHGIAKRVLESGEAVITIDAMDDERYRDQLSVHDLKLRSVLCLPMIARGRVLGAIYLDNRFRTSAFDVHVTDHMESFAHQAAIALENAQLLADMASSRDALERAQAEVKALNARLQEELEARTQELEHERLVVRRQREQLTGQHQYEAIIGESDALQGVFRVMDRLLDNEIPVLIEGESGTGKELVARAIHFSGARQRGPFVALNCGAIPANLLESELFGHARGAFTGAQEAKDGVFQAAHGGTLLLDELGELPLEMQVALLRVLQSGDIRKVGSSQEEHVDVRIVAATNRKLEEEVAEGRFREDLYYRLAVIPIRMPALRERSNDIPLLVQHFIEANTAAGLGAITGISRGALKMLNRYHWPGNVRQLEMVLKNASLFAETEVLQAEDFQAFPELVGSKGAERAPSLSGKRLSEIEREAIIQALRDNKGNKKRSAEQLGIDRRTLYNKLAAYEIRVERDLRVR